jgi:glucokinase
MLLAGDVGGTKTLIGLFDQLPLRPRPIVVREFTTLDYSSLSDILAEFSQEEDAQSASIGAAVFGVAGPVSNNVARLTNVPWSVDGGAIAGQLRLGRVGVINDLEAMAFSVPLLAGDELHVLREGEPAAGRNMALIAAGTGLGEALLHFVDGRYVPSASESGHADFAARTDRDIALLRLLTARRGRASVEDVVSGQGLVNFHAVTHDAPCPAVTDLDSPDAPAAISTAALEKRCHGCVAALESCVEAYGAEAGNLALRSLATAGVFVGGGIAPKILAALTDGRFLDAFTAKAPFDRLLERVPVSIIMNERAGLLGAAVYAAQLFAARAGGRD